MYLPEESRSVKSIKHITQNTPTCAPRSAMSVCLIHCKPVLEHPTPIRAPPKERF